MSTTRKTGDSGDPSRGPRTGGFTVLSRVTGDPEILYGSRTKKDSPGSVSNYDKGKQQLY